MKYFIGLTLVATAFLTGGCATAPQQPVPLSQMAIGGQPTRIGVGMTALPKLDTQVPGAGCLLCLAVATAANSTLTSHAQSLSYEDLPNLKKEIAGLLQKTGAAVTVIDDELNIESLSSYDAKGPNIARKDFSPLQAKYQIDKLLVIEISALGFIRTYSAYVPTSDPKGFFQGKGYMVNLKTNTYEWYQPTEIAKSADQQWDEPPKFPGLTNAYYQALELGKESYLRPFSTTLPRGANAGSEPLKVTTALPGNGAGK